MAKSKQEGRQSRHKRIRKKVSGTGQRSRLSVYRSLAHIYGQIIDDTRGITLVSASSFEVNPPSPPVEKRGKGELKQYKGNIKTAKAVGTLIAERALKKGIKSIVFDRGGYLYHGRVKALAEAVREAGLEF